MMMMMKMTKGEEKYLPLCLACGRLVIIIVVIILLKRPYGVEAGTEPST